MTNVPGLGFVVILAAIGLFLALPVLAAVSLLVARATSARIEWALVGTHAVALVGGVGVAVLNLGTDLDLAAGVIVGLLRTTAVVLVAGLFLAVVVEGIPIAAGAAVTVVLREVSWPHALRCATAGYALGGIGGALAGIALTSALEAAALGALLAAPGALGSVALDAAASRFLRGRLTA
ncbi:hypothetical protein [Halobellus captivus]|uniref:hypothetical protein n=1 Tax=Halobellus captivus TaxID=2592614 RepID=UPI00119F366F|nr:hypothetical protein [Halobellus captivus]